MSETKDARIGTSFTRRSFLKSMGAIGGAVAAGGCLAGAATIAAADNGGDGSEGQEQTLTTYCNACMGCPLEAVVRDDNVVMTRAAEIPGTTRDIKRICARGASIPTLLVEDKRVKYPMRRVEGTERGAGQWERISWDDAISEICEKINDYQKEFGPGSVCAFTYGTTEPRNLYNLYRLENLAQFSHQNRTTDQALAQSLMWTIGGYFYMAGNNSDVVEQKKTFVVWGHNPIVSWPNMWRFIANEIENGGHLVVVDPNYNTIAQKADLFVPVRPGTDGALALGMINYMEQNGLTDDASMQQKSVAPFLVKTSDGKYLRKSDLESGIEAGSDADDYAVWDDDTGSLGYASTTKNPALRKETFEVDGYEVSTCYNMLLGVASEWDMDRTVEVTDVPEDTIVRFVDLLVGAGTGGADIFQGYGMDHYTHGYNNIAAVSALRIVGGMVPDPKLPYSLNDSGFTQEETDHATTTAQLGTWMFNDLLDTGKYTFPDITMNMGGQETTLPGTTIEQPLKMLINFGGNLLNSAPNRNESVEAYKKFDFVVVTNVEWCDTCDMADIVLPAAMIQESIGPIAMNGSIVFGEQCITPRFEAKPDFEIAKLIAQGIGLGDYFQEDMDTAMAHTMDTQVMQMMGLTYDMLKQQKIIYLNDEMPLPQYLTSTGRLAFYQEMPGPFEYYGQMMDPTKVMLPVWMPPEEAWTVDAGGFPHSALSEKYPLLVFAGTRRFRVHSFYGQNPLLREMEIDEPCVRMNPVDAEARGINEGDYVKLYNDRGHAVAKALFSEGIRPGMLDIDRGWQASQYKSGCSQELTSKQIVDWSCPNYGYHDCLCEMELWNGQD